MFYRPGNDTPNLAHNPFKAIVSPRPIGWISSVGANGIANLAPYSFFNAVADNPPTIMFASSGVKDSVTNIRASGEFAVNIVSFALRDKMNATSEILPADLDEFDHAHITKAPCNLISAPRVADAPATLECKLFKIVELPGTNNLMVIATIVGIHLDDSAIVNGIFDVTRYVPLARMGYQDYTSVKHVFPLKRPE